MDWYNIFDSIIYFIFYILCQGSWIIAIWTGFCFDRSKLYYSNHSNADRNNNCSEGVKKDGEFRIFL